MSIIRKSTLLSFGLLMTLCGVSTDGKFVAGAVTSNQSTIKPQSEILKESAKTKPAFQETSDAVKVTQNRVKVFFPNYSRNTTDLGHVEPVLRTTQRRDLSRFAIEQLIVGPTSNETRMGFIKPIQFRGSSNCGSDFTLSISSGVARIKFCKIIPSAGIGDDARVTSSIKATLKQFSTVKSVIILTKEGDCLGDMSGENLCLRRR
ncbi:GerMN domain-containing protein [Argonema galeatum]|uniref:GerMN domain-containing protein n=1 Tax=Argonema galeatum TaxID=2942762 RepID=UPI002013866D|nr:GerMN domain-containing protein [Argonema galeatum]MCL1463437.1 GerMN domain-containing protein [Argonema galeatum A003/A1]